jgi:hypothetical protein
MDPTRDFFTRQASQRMDRMNTLNDRKRYNKIIQPSEQSASEFVERTSTTTNNADQKILPAMAKIPGKNKSSDDRRQ